MAEKSHNLPLMKKLKVNWKDLIIFAETFILLVILFDHWDEVKAWIGGLFS